MLELNKIYLQDCLEGMKEIEDKSVDMILTDIPYNQTNSRLNYNLRDINKGVADILTFDLEKFLEQCVRVCNGIIYVFFATEQVSFVRQYLDHHSYTTRLCIWEKTNPAPSNGQYMWLSGIETCVFGVKSKRRGGNPIFNEHCKNTVWRFPVGKSKIHPTEKPLALFEYLIKTSSNESSIILDPCMGSGTTAVAAIKTNRQYIGFENNEEYFKLANERIDKVITEKMNSK